MFQLDKYRANNDDYVFHIDESNSTITGWIVGKNYPIKELIVRYQNSEQKIILDKIRPGVKDLFKGIEVNTLCGFSFVPQKNENLTLCVQINNTVMEIVKSSYINKKIIFVHIAKTAGTTINNFFINQLGESFCATHIESNKNWIDDINDKNYISGHIVLEEFKKKIPYLEHCYTMVSLREPVSHVISHLAWIRYLSEEGQERRLNNHPEYIRNLSLKMKSFDFSQPENITALLNTLTMEEFNLLDNVQTRYLRKKIGVKVSLNDVDDALLNTEYFNSIGFDDDIEGFLKKTSEDLHFNYRPVEKKENVLNNKFGLKNTPEFAKVLMPLIEYDIILYNCLISGKKKLPIDYQKNIKKSDSTKFNDINTSFQLTEIDTLVRKSDTPLLNEHLSYYEYLPKAVQNIEPYIWLGNTLGNNFKRDTSDIPPANFYEFKSVYLAGQGCIIDEYNRLFVSPYLQMANRYLKVGGINPILIDSSNTDSQKISFKRVLNIRSVKDVPCVPLSRPGEAVYGHWLVDILPRVVFAQEFLNNETKYISTIHLPDYARKFLNMLGVKDANIINYSPMTEVILMEHCYFPSYLRYESAFSTLAAKLNEKLMPYLSMCKNRKLFISRGDYNNAQSIVNWLELKELIISYGIEIIEPHKYSIEEQIRLFSEASFIIGEYGSAMHNTFFCHPNTKVIVLQSDSPLPFVQAGIGALLNQPTGFVFGKHVKENNRDGRSFYANLELIKQAIELSI